MFGGHNLVITEKKKKDLRTVEIPIFLFPIIHSAETYFTHLEMTIFHDICISYSVETFQTSNTKRV